MALVDLLPNRICTNDECPLAADCGRRRPRARIGEVEYRHQPLTWSDGTPYCALQLPAAEDKAGSAPARPIIA